MSATGERCRACDKNDPSVGDGFNTLPMCAQCAKAHRMGYRCGQVSPDDAVAKELTEKGRHEVLDAVCEARGWSRVPLADALTEIALMRCVPRPTTGHSCTCLQCCNARTVPRSEPAKRCGCGGGESCGICDPYVPRPAEATPVMPVFVHSVCKGGEHAHCVSHVCGCDCHESGLRRESDRKTSGATEVECSRTSAPPAASTSTPAGVPEEAGTIQRMFGDHMAESLFGASDPKASVASVRCFACASQQPEAACSHWVGIGWSCSDRKACRARRATPDDPPTPTQALDGLFNGAVSGGIGGVHAAKLFNIARKALDDAHAEADRLRDPKCSRGEYVAALEAMEDSAMACAAHLIAKWLRRYAAEQSGSHPANAGYIACNAAATELETGRANWRNDV